jgi:hypothetical protein
VTRAAELLAGVVGVPLSFVAIASDSWWPVVALVVVLAVSGVLYARALPRIPDDDWDTCPCSFHRNHPYDPLTGDRA